MKLQVGRTYASEDGCLSTIKGFVCGEPYPYLDQDGCQYDEGGRSQASGSFDLVREVEVAPDPLVASLRSEIARLQEQVERLETELGEQIP